MDTVLLLVVTAKPYRCLCRRKCADKQRMRRQYCIGIEKFDVNIFYNVSQFGVKIGSYLDKRKVKGHCKQNLYEFENKHYDI